MSILLKVIFTAAIIDSSLIFAFADEIKVIENTAVEICGSMVSVDGIWVNEGIIKADISVFRTTRRKPIIGGYKKGDEIVIDEKSDCRYYINLISKSGLKNNFGFVILSSYIPLGAVQVCDEDMIFYESNSYKIDTLDWYVSKIVKNEESKYKYVAEIHSSYISMYISGFYLYEGDIVWMGECAYKLENVLPSSNELKDMEGNYKYNPGMLVFKKLNEVSYSHTEYIIRKAKIYMKKRPSKEEIKNTREEIWLLKIYFYSRGMASLGMDIERDGKKIWVEFDPVRTFKDEKEALDYARENGITDVKIEE